MNERSDNEDAKETKSRTDSEDPKCIRPYTDNEEPSRAKLRSDIVEPSSILPPTERLPISAASEIFKEPAVVILAAEPYSSVNTSIKALPVLNKNFN
jgi:hypothetical protein